jgi:hypothetical protein
LITSRAGQSAHFAQAFTTTSPPMIQNMSKPRRASMDSSLPVREPAVTWSFSPIAIPRTGPIDR